MCEDPAATYCLACKYDAGTARAECCPECGGELSLPPPPQAPTDKFAKLALLFACVLLPMTCFGGLLMVPPIYGSVTKLNVAVSFVFLLVTSIGAIRCARVLSRLKVNEPTNRGVALAHAATMLLCLEVLIVLVGTFLIIDN